ncbi:MAG: hypothetical protein FJW30_25130 [Acidobacteria bacterium]|nr:hypothetical protein [Acidobacteriota bacterium]
MSCQFHGPNVTISAPVPKREVGALVAAMLERRSRYLHISADIDDALLARLARSVPFKKLTIEGAPRITQAGLRHFETLESVDISGYRGTLTDSSLEFIGRNRGLRSVQFAWQQNVTGAGLAALRHCDKLEQVNLMGTNTGDEVLEALAGKPRLHLLSTGRKTTGKGLALLRQFPKFAKPDDSPVECDLMSFQSPKNHILLDGPIEDADLNGLRGLDGLQGLNLFWHIGPITAAGLLRIQDLPNLQHFGIDGKLCDDAAMARIANFPKIRHLQAQGAVATTRGFQALGKCRTLEFLWGRDCSSFSTAGAKALSHLTGLGITLKDVDLKVLPSFPNLRQLMPMDAVDAEFRHVSACAGLERLWCMYCRETGDAATEHLAGHPRLRTYYAGQTKITDQSLAILAGLPALEEVEIWNCAGVTPGGLRRLKKSVRVRS